MKRILRAQQEVSSALFGWASSAFCVLLSLSASAANDTWVGAGADPNWLTPANWSSLPVAGDSLFFTGTTKLVNSNNFAGGTTFSSLTFATPAGAFSLGGNFISLSGNLTNNQVVTLETINFPISLLATPTIDVVTNGALALNGVVSGSFGVTKVDGGTLTLGANNTFTGPLQVNGGTVLFTTDNQLGAIPGSATPGDLVLNGGAISTTNTQTLSANRGIAVGPTAGSDSGSIIVGRDPSIVVSYSGIIANNGAGTGGLTKGGFGGLTLGGANTYTGPTVVQVGTLTLDYTQATAPQNNMINSASSLTLGGANSGVGTTNFASLVMNGKAAVANSQTFSSTHLTFAGSQIVVTNGNLGSATLNLGLLDHAPGGTLVMVSPSIFDTNNANAFGKITTTAANVNGVLGGWATIGNGSQNFGLVLSTNLAAVDVNGNVVNYTNYTKYASSTVLHGTVFATNNLIIDNTSGGDVKVDNDGAASVTDVNTITSIGRGAGAYSIIIGTNNILRLGQYGVIFRGETDSQITAEIGESPGGASPAAGAGAQGIGSITAGGATNTDGEVIFHLNSSSESGGSVNVEANIIDSGTNGLGKVTVVKMGPSSMKMRGRNSYSGGTYVLQGRFQIAGSEIGAGNNDGAGTGPIFILPGCYLFPSGIAGLPLGITNAVSIAGNGTQAEPLGAIRGGTFSGPMTLIGDTDIGGGTLLLGPISGAFNLTLGSQATITGGATLANSGNSWSGDTILTARTAGSGNNTVTSSNNEVIPNGFGKGNVIMRGSGGVITWNINGRTETINGLSTTADTLVNNAVINNASASSAAKLVFGDNDQSGTFAGNFTSAAGTLGLVKIGNGLETFSGSNNFLGTLTVSNGTLALAAATVMTPSSGIIVSTNGSLDISGDLSSANLPAFTIGSSLTVDGGTLIGNSGSSIGTLNLTNNARLTLKADSTVTNLFATTLTTGVGSTVNTVNIPLVVPTVTGYPTPYSLIKYVNFSSVTNFALGLVPSTNTLGFFSNDISSKRIILVLTNGPALLAWRGDKSWDWDIDTTSNWFSLGNSVRFHQADFVGFDDTGVSNLVNVVGSPQPSGLTINSALNYTFFGSGNIVGNGTLTKQGSGTATFLTADSYSGGVSMSGGTLVLAANNNIAGGTTLSGGTLVIGTNGGSGNVPTGPVVLNSALVINNGSALNLNNIISGSSSGSIYKTNALDTSVLTISGNNTFTGTVFVASGTLKVGSATGLGATNNGVNVSGTGTLEINGFALGGEPVSVAGNGVSSNGAIVNTGAAQNNALRNVTLAADTTFGGTARWDIRETSSLNDATLLGTGGITKVGTNQVTIIGAQLSGSVGNIFIKQGTLGIERNTPLNGSSTITVTNGATLELQSNTVTLQPSLVLYGNGTNASVFLTAGKATVNNTAAVNGTVLFDGNGTEVRIQGVVNGSGGIMKNGRSQLTIAAPASYNGTTVITNGSVVFDSNKTGGTGVTVYTNGFLGGGSLAGSFSIGENVTLNGGGFAPGNDFVNPQEILTVNGNVTMNSSSNVISLTSDLFGVNDLVVVNGNLTMTGSNVFRISVFDHLSLSNVYTILSYTGTTNGVDTNHIVIVPPPFGYQFSLINPATTPGTIQIMVAQAIGFDFWTGSDPVHPTFWDTATTTNWDQNGPNSFKSNDFACFSDVRGGLNPNSTNISLIGTLSSSGVIFSNQTFSYTLAGSGKISGAGGLLVEGGGGGNGVFPTVTLANTGSNDWTGGVVVDAQPDIYFAEGILMAGNGSLAGNLGRGTITNDGLLAFNYGGLPVLGANPGASNQGIGTLGFYPNAVIISNNIVNGADSGSFGHVDPIIIGPLSTNGVFSFNYTNITAGNGIGVVVFAGTNTFTNDVFVNRGIAVAGIGAAADFTAFGGTNGGTVWVTNNATLDVNSYNLGNKRVVAFGNGFGGQGVIVNNNSNAQTQAFQSVTLRSSVTFGGMGRWDIRSSSPGAGLSTLVTLPTNSTFSITKTGTNQVSLVGITNIDSSILNIDIQQGTFAVQIHTTQVGDPAGVVTIRSNAVLNFFRLSDGRPFNKIQILQNGGTIWNESSTSTNIGSITLSGSNTFNVVGNLVLVSNTLSGVANVYKVGAGNLQLYDNVTYTGNTTISNGTVSLFDNVTLANSPVIDLATNVAVIDVSGRVDQRLTLSGSQQLLGTGTIIGDLAMGASTVLTPGHPVGFLNVSNSVPSSVILNGTVNLQLDAASVTNDSVNDLTGGMQYGGVLNVTLANGTLAAGQTYHLFSATNMSGAFTATNLPVLIAPLYWTNVLVNGSITVASAFVPSPVITTITLSGVNAVISGTNGSPGATFRVLSSTNVSLPLSNWTVIATNTFDGSGNVVNYTVTNAVSGPQRFYILQTP